MTKKHNYLSDSTIQSIIRYGRSRHHFSLLRNHELTHHQKYRIAEEGTGEVYHEMLDHHELDHDTKLSIAHHGAMEHIDKLLQNHVLDRHTINAIATYHGSNEQRTKLLDNHKLSHMALFHIANRGTEEHRDRILNGDFQFDDESLKHNPEKELDFYTKAAIYRKGNSRQKAKAIEMGYKP